MTERRPAAAATLRPRPWHGAQLLVLGLLWGSSFPLIAVGVSAIPPLSLAALRVAVAMPCLWLALLLLTTERPVRFGAVRAHFVMGALNNAVPFALIAWSQLHIPSGLAAILVATTPLMGAAFAAAWLPDEPVTSARVAGCAAGLAGIALIAGVEAAGQGAAELAGTAACLLGALSFAAAGTFGRRFAAAGVSPLAVATGQVTASVCLLLPLALIADRPWLVPVPRAEAWAAVGALGVVSTALGYVLYFRILAGAGSTNILLVNLLVPIPAMVAGRLWLGEALSVAHYAGLALIAGGLLAADGRLWRR